MRRSCPTFRWVPGTGLRALSKKATAVIRAGGVTLKPLTTGGWFELCTRTGPTTASLANWLMRLNGTVINVGVTLAGGREIGVVKPLREVELVNSTSVAPAKPEPLIF